MKPSADELMFILPYLVLIKEKYKLAREKCSSCFISKHNVSVNVQLKRMKVTLAYLKQEDLSARNLLPRQWKR
jgi:hypothetical protein